MIQHLYHTVLGHLQHIEENNFPEVDVEMSVPNSFLCMVCWQKNHSLDVFDLKNFGWYFRIIFGILSELILSTCSFQFFLYWYMNSGICDICNC
jgi:hypothetical protein